MAQTTLNTILDREMKVQQAYQQSQELQKQVQVKQQEIGNKIKELE
jgi:hypothetical protein